jgi:selenocysteine-specific elongation factor
MRVIGTAGHVDHGKSTLIAALTGTHPDRLKEEQEREMTIELGFGWLTLPNGEEIGIVDVPGHRDFIANMLAGVGGIDAALLIIAADEGIMPQTREHLAILNLLQIPNGVVVITKADMIDDPEWFSLLEADIRTALKNSVLQNAPLVTVSARTGAGLNDLLSTLTETLQNTPARLDLGRPRLPIDRAFSMPGFGTVVTGTLSDGHFSVSDEVEILPGAIKGRIRGLQTHKKKEESAQPGSRTAINISGVALEEIARGQVVCAPGRYTASQRIDARFHLLPEASAPLKHGTEVKCYIGASETVASLRLLGVETLQPDESAWIQLELRQPVVAARGDRYILRRPSPSETLGGGQITDPLPKARHKRFDDATLKRLAALEHGTPADILLQASLALGTASRKEIVERARLPEDEAQAAWQELLENGQLLTLDGDALVIALPHWNNLRGQVLNTLATYHIQFPLKRGMPREELKSRVKLTPRVFGAALKKLATDGEIREGGAWLAMPGHAIVLTDAQQARGRSFLLQVAKTPFGTPPVKEAEEALGADIFYALVELGEITLVSADVFFRTADYEQMVAQIRVHLQAHGQITVAEVRDMFETSRKYVLALMEHLDSQGVTMRSGDYRKLRK